MDNIQLSQAAEVFLHAGLSVLPAWRKGEQKGVALSAWKPYQERLPTDAEIRSWFGTNCQALCLVCGAVSGNLEVIDFDLAGDAFEPWCNLVREQASGLLDRLVIESTPSGGRHVIYRCEAPVCGNMKLAQRKLSTASSDPVTIAGKTFEPRKDAQGNWSVLLTLIETRGEGGIFLCWPSEGYNLLQGSLTALPIISADEREILLSAAWALNEYHPEPEPVPGAPVSGMLRPGDDYSQRGDVRAVLLKHGWVLARPGENEYWRRPGRSYGWSATLRNRVFYVFSSNAAPFEPNKAYSPFAVYTLLEHGGDFAAAAQALRTEGYGSAPEIVLVETDDSEDTTETIDPGPIPDELLHMPGFVDEVMQFTLATAPYPEPVIAFAGALALQAVLAGRKVRDRVGMGNRTNLYILSLANSGVGKDHARQINTKILYEVGLADHLGTSFASGEGIEDRLFAQPATLFQVDEFDGVLLRVSQAKDARHEQIVSILLQMYSAASSAYVMRAKAGRERLAIDQPCLCLFCTAVPKHFYEALSARLLTNGFLARFLVLECHGRGSGRDDTERPIPESILEAARWWADFRPGGSGNLADWHPVPYIIPETPDATMAFRFIRERADAEYAKCEEANDPAGMAIWARVHEKARRLALIYACSADREQLIITEEAARWASAFVEHQTRRMLWMAQQYASESDFDAKRKRLLEVLTKWRQQHGDAWMPFWKLSRKLPWSSRDHEEVRNTLLEQRLIEYQIVATGGRPGAFYRLAPPKTTPSENGQCYNGRPK